MSFTNGAVRRGDPMRVARSALLALTTGMAALLGSAAFIASAAAQGSPPQAPPVSVAPAVQRAITESEEFSGRLEAAEYVEVRPRIAGTIDKVNFTDGASVKKGQLLFAIDPRPFEAEVARAQAQVTSTRARAELASSELGRAQKLVDSKAISKSEVDQLGSGSKTAAADIQAAEAALRTARLNLDYASVRAPIAGRVSRANITAGNLVNDQSLLTTIAGVDKVYAYFDGSEITYLKLQKARMGGKVPKVLLQLADEKDFPHEGSLDFVDNRLDPRTGAIRLRASFDNAKGQFTPGLSAKMRMDDPTAATVILVPERAIGTDQSKKFVYVVAADGKPQFREIRMGTLRDGMRVVTNGSVKPGENVVVEGLQRIQPGGTVSPQVLKVDDQGRPIFPPPQAPGGAPAAKG
ncbi:MAG: efflux transporter, family, subunit [Rhizobacter sp.]|nr:efflux transporter, family, subunit [Rhizobacter sp.]